MEFGENSTMATPNQFLISSLRQAATRLATGASYQWGHFGQCNCGHLAQAVTGLSAAQIHTRTFDKLMEWSEIPESYCPQTGVATEYAIDALLEVGLDRDDVRHLEDLSDPVVLREIPLTMLPLRRNQREHAVAYLSAWAQVLERQLKAREGQSKPSPRLPLYPGITRVEQMSLV
jgi:hypothetical protein